MTGSINMQDNQTITSAGSLSIYSDNANLSLVGGNVTGGLSLSGIEFVSIISGSGNSDISALGRSITLRAANEGSLNLLSDSYDVNISAGTSGAINTIGSIIPGSNNLYTLGTSAYRWNSISVELSAGTSAMAYQSQLVLYNTMTSAMSYASNAYSCVVQDGSGQIILDATMRGRTYIVKQNGAIITFTHSLTANDDGFFVMVKNGNGTGSGGDISISGASGNTTVHQTTSTQNGQIVYVFWDGATLTAY
jgi:hypothetical protein